MKFKISFLGFLLLFVVGTSNAFQVTKWDQSELQSRATVRFTELLQTLEPMHFWSTDRYTLRLVGMGLGGPHALGPSVVVDHILTTPRFMDRIQYELIPLVSQDIQSIRYEPGPISTADGRLANGVLYVETRRPTGFTVQNAVGWTNETGDPGPYLYTDVSSRNVDRSGPTLGVRVSWGGEKWFVKGAFDTDAFHMTDPRTDGRVWKTYSGHKKALVYHATPNLTVSYRGEQSRFGLAVSRAVKTDFLYEEIASTEWPLRQYRTTVGSLYERTVSNSMKLGARSGFTQLKTGNLDARIDLPNNLHIDESYAESYLSGQWDGVWGEWNVGGRMDRLSQEDHVSNRVQKRIYSRGRVGWTLEEASQVTLDASVSTPFSDIGYVNHLSYAVGASALVPTFNGGQFTVGATLGRDDRAGLWSTWNLRKAGVLFDEWAPIVTTPSNQPMAEFLDAFLTLSGQLSAQTTFWTDIRGRKQSRLTVPDRAYEKEISNQNYVFSAPTRFSTNQSGYVIRPSLGITVVSEKSRFNLMYEYRRIIAEGNFAYWKYVVGLPAHRLTASLASTPVERLTLFVLVRWQNETFWAEYIPDSNHDLSGFIQIETSLTKYLWSDHLKLGLSFLNIADQPIVRHPAGVNEQFAVRLSIAAFFNDEAARN